MDLLNKLIKAFEGYKSYIVSIVTGALGIWSATGHAIPEWIWIVLGAAGLASIRSAIGGGQK